MNLLVIDDDAQLRQFVRKVMELAGWRVAESADGAGGVLQAGASCPDVILCDFDMERMNGHEVLAALRAKDSTATIPFILMTGKPEVADARATMELGADDYIPKPFSAEGLVKAVAARMARVQRDREAAERKLGALRAGIAAALPHGLKTPLNGILGYSQLLDSDFDAFSREEIRQMLGTIHQSATALDRAVNRFILYTELLLIAARGPSAPGVAKGGPVTGAEIATVAREVAARHGRASDLQIAATGERAAIASAHLIQLTEELVDNALKFSPPGSAVTLSTCNEESQFVLTMEDSGRGMTPEQIKQVGAFVQFERRRYEQQGSGLGLELVRLIARVNAGTMSIESEAGSATRVCVRLPAP